MKTFKIILFVILGAIVVFFLFGGIFSSHEKYDENAPAGYDENRSNAPGPY